MFNVHLLQLNLDVKGYEALRNGPLYSGTYRAGLPAYVIARCPICKQENIERLDTYSLRYWPGINTYSGKSVWGEEAIVHHCRHFALVQPFVNFNGLEPLEARNEYGPEVPHVLGYLLELGYWFEPGCLAVIHALPVCRTENKTFVPRYTLFLISYFSKYEPEYIRDQVFKFNAYFWEIPYVQMFSEPPDGRESWWNLKKWVAEGKLFWLDTRQPTLELRTKDVEAFPYGNISGRTYPYFESYPPQKGAKEIPRPQFTGAKPRIKAFKRDDVYDEYDSFFGRKVEIEWEGIEGLGFMMSNYPVAYYCLPPENWVGPGKNVQILVREIWRFFLRRDAATGLTEVVMDVRYPPGERTLGLTDNEEEARRWVKVANAVKASIRR